MSGSQRSVLFDSGFASSTWNDPRSGRAVTLVAVGIVLTYEGLADQTSGFSGGAVLIGGMLLLAAARLFFVIGRQVSMLQRLGRHGSIARGHVTALRKSFLAGGYVIRYRFVDFAGREHEGRRVLHQRAAFLWRVGDTGSVRFDPTEPSQSVWIGHGIELDDAGGAARGVGTVVGVTEKLLDGQPTDSVRYRYVDHLGATHEGQFHDRPGGGYRTGDTGEVTFSLRHPNLNSWRRRAGVSPLSQVPSVAPAHRHTHAPTLGARPSKLTLVRRSKYVRRAAFHGVYALTGMAILVIFFTDIDEWRVIAGLTLFIAFFSFWLVRNLRAGTREVTEWYRLVRAGVPVQAVVTLVDQHVWQWRFWSWTVGWEISYQYADSRGDARTGESGYLSRRQASRWRVGDACLVMVDPDRSERSVWIG